MVLGGTSIASEETILVAVDRSVVQRELSYVRLNVQLGLGEHLKVLKKEVFSVTVRQSKEDVTEGQWSVTGHPAELQTCLASP